MHYVAEVWLPQETEFSQENIENKIKEIMEPYNEQNNKTSFVDVEEEHRKQYENDTRQEFYCDSCSSWGQSLTPEQFQQLEGLKTGMRMKLDVKESMFQLYELRHKYNCYDNTAKKYPDKHIWVEVDCIVKTNHPNKEVCFTGIVEVRKIDPPKEFKLTEYYSTFEEFMEEWSGYEKNDEGKYGYYKNLNGFYDWYQIGGRYTGRKIKDYDPRKDPQNFEKCIICNGTGYRNDDLGVKARLENPNYNCNGCGDDLTKGTWIVSPGVSLKWHLNNDIKLNCIPVKDITEESTCYTVIYRDIVKHQETWDGENFNETDDFDGNLLKFIEENNITDGYFVTVDYHV